MLIDEIEKEINLLRTSPKNLSDYSKFSKGHDKPDIRIKTQIVRRISSKFYKEIKYLPKNKILSICEELLKKNKWELKIIAFDWAYRVRKEYSQSDFLTFERWMDLYVRGWEDCDDLSLHSLGYFLFVFPEKTKFLSRWAKSKKLWKRRAASTSLIYSIRQNRVDLKLVLKIAKILSNDYEELVLKGVGWTLKEASNFFPREVLHFLERNQKNIKSLVIRYALEKYPKNKREKLLNAI